jgi:hypothetical protein
VKTAEYLRAMMREQVDAVGPKNVTLIVTDSASNGKKAGLGLASEGEEYSHIGWCPCNGHCMDLFLAGVLKMPWAEETIANTVMVINFMR